MALAGNLNRDRVAEHGLDAVRQVALDDVWSALRLKSAEEACDRPPQAVVCRWGSFQPGRGKWQV